MIYFLAARALGKVKVGFTDDLQNRFRDLQTASPCQLELIETIEGGREDERAIHLALLKRGNGEWFPHKQAMRLLRAIRRAGLAACSAFVRWERNEKLARIKRAAFAKKALDIVKVRVAKAVLDTVPQSQIKAVTGVSPATWHITAHHGNTPSLHAFLNGCRIAPKYLTNYLRVVHRVALVAKADKRRAG